MAQRCTGIVKGSAGLATGVQINGMINADGTRIWASRRFERTKPFGLKLEERMRREQNGPVIDGAENTRENSGIVKGSFSRATGVNSQRKPIPIMFAISS